MTVPKLDLGELRRVATLDTALGGWGPEVLALLDRLAEAEVVLDNFGNWEDDALWTYIDDYRAKHLKETP